VAAGTLALLALARAAAAEEPALVHQDLTSQLLALRQAAVALPVAAGLGSLLAFRPRRAGTPERVPAVIHTQIMLAILGALVMLVVGPSLARAFGIVGAAGLIRYRAKIDDPKDAGVMLSTLGIGLAAGVELYLVAAFATVFILTVLWLVESLAPRASQLFTLSVAAKQAAAMRAGVERILRRAALDFELRTSASESLCYEVRVPVGRRLDRVSDAIVALDGGEDAAVEWQDKKPKKL
jgi:hypothetical protein